MGNSKDSPTPSNNNPIPSKPARLFIDTTSGLYDKLPESGVYQSYISAKLNVGQSGDLAILSTNIESGVTND